MVQILNPLISILPWQRAMTNDMDKTIALCIRGGYKLSANYIASKIRGEKLSCHSNSATFIHKAELLFYNSTCIL